MNDKKESINKKENGTITINVSDNLSLWDKVFETDPDFAKEFKGKGGFIGTAVCAQHQIFNATKIWGPMGYKWGVIDEEIKLHQIGEDSHNWQRSYTALLYYPFGTETCNLLISSDIDVFTYSATYKTWRLTNDWAKKLVTDALTKGLSKLGFNADIFMGRFDGNKYFGDKDNEEKQLQDWEKDRKKKLGGSKGKNKDKTWMDLDMSTLIYYSTNYEGKFKKYSDLEIEFREQENLAGVDPDDYTKLKEEDEFYDMKKEVIKFTEGALQDKFITQSVFDNYTAQIIQAKTEENIILLKSKVTALCVLYETHQSHEMSKDKYKSQLKLINSSKTIADLEIAVKMLKNMAPTHDDDVMLLDEYRKIIGDYHTKLQYEAKHATNSMLKWLGKDDQYACNDKEKLKAYINHLEKDKGTNGKKEPLAKKPDKEIKEILKGDTDTIVSDDPDESVPFSKKPAEKKDEGGIVLE